MTCRPTGVPITHDDRGNLTYDGRFTYDYDEANRMVSAEPANITAATPNRVEFGYDDQSLRAWKKTYTWDPTAGVAGTGAWVLTAHRKFVYNASGQLTGEFEAGANGVDRLVRSFVWGIGGLGGAGGVGALLSITTYNANGDGTAAKVYLPLYDGQWNVVGLLDAASGTLVATYEYDPFGNYLSAPQGDPEALAANPFGFATQYRDAETGLYCFAYRYYSPTLGRWMTRDPIAEDGGVNLYAYPNDPINRVDPLGLYDTVDSPEWDGSRFLRNETLWAGTRSAWNREVLIATNHGRPVTESVSRDDGTVDVFAYMEYRWKEQSKLDGNTYNHRGWRWEQIGHFGLEDVGRITPSTQKLYEAYVLQQQFSDEREANLLALASAIDVIGSTALDLAADFNLWSGIRTAVTGTTPSGEKRGLVSRFITLTPLVFVGFKMAMAGKQAVRLGARWKPASVTDPNYAKGCEKVANQILKLLGGGTKYTIKSKLGGKVGLGPYRDHAFEWFEHEVVVHNGRVYDAFTGHEGLPIEDFKKLWTYPEGINFPF